MDIREIANMGLMNYFFYCQKLDSKELLIEKDNIIYEIDNIEDVVNMWSNNGNGWVHEDTHAHAMDMCDDALKPLKKLETKLEIVAYFL